MIKHRQLFPFLYPLLALGIVLSVTLFFYFGKFDGNITGFFRIGSVLPLSPYLPKHSLIFQGELGYDGQQFLTIAFDPWLKDPDSIAALDNPKYRYRRLLYPLLANLLSFGNSQLIPYLLVGINIIVIVAMVWLLGRYFQTYGISPLQSLLVLTIPGTWMSLSLSTADLLTSLFLVLTVTSYRNQQPILTTLWITLGCLTRETVLILWLGTAIVSFWDKNKQQIYYLIGGLVPIFAWHLSVIWRFQNIGNYGAKSNFGYPFQGIINKLTPLLSQPPGAKQLLELYLFGLLIFTLIAILSLSYQSLKQSKLILTTSLLYGLVLTCSTTAILGYFIDYSRVYLDLYFLLLLVTVKKRLKLVPFALGILPSLAFILGHS